MKNFIAGAFSWWRGSLLFLIAYSLLPSLAQAVPSFARQTGAECAACHTVYLELAPFGRLFKFRGYTSYNRFNGASANYDGNGRNAKDNNSIYLLAWVLL